MPVRYRYYGGCLSRRLRPVQEDPIAGLSREFRLAAACCIRPSTAAVERIRDLVEAGVDWAMFGRIVARQRIEGLANEALKQAEVQLPRDIAKALGAASANIARTSLAYAAEAVRLHDILEREGIGHRYLKGSTLSMLAYGGLGLKHARDIDLLIDPLDVERSCALLVAAGYRRVRPAEDVGDAGFQAWMAVYKESSWQNKTGLLVEVHHGLMDNPHLLEGVSIHSPSQDVDIGGNARLPTLGKDELFAYLCVHGASHAWSRLKWLADVAALLKDEDAAELARLHDRAVELGAGRCAGTALLLCSLLFGSQLPSELDTRLRCDGPTLCLVRTSVRMMTTGDGAEELEQLVLGTVPLHLSLFLLKPGLRYKLAELRQKLVRPDDHAALQLPRWLGFLYPLLLFPRWLGFRLDLAARSGAPNSGS